MRLNDLKKNTPLMLEVVIAGKHYPMSITVHKVLNHSLIAPVIMNNGQPLILGTNDNFKDAIYNIIYAKDNSRLIWENVPVETIRNNGYDWYQLTFTPECMYSKDADRRVDPRIPVGFEGMCVPHGLFAMSLPVKIRDISNTGVAFSYPIDLGILNSDIQMTIQCVANGQKFNCDLKLYCLRVATPLGNSGYTYGCQIVEKNKDYSKLINSYHMDELNFIQKIR